MFKIALLLFLGIYANAAITIAASANVQYALNDIIKEFENFYNIKAKQVISSSGKLSLQITKGAPYDIFLSADMKYPLFLYKKGYAATKPKVYAKGSLVLWTMKGVDLKDWENSLIKEAKKIAVANPKNAPYGKAAMEVLKRKGVFDKVKKKLIFGDSVSQTNQYIASKIADAGFSAKAVVLSPKMRGKGEWIEMDKTLYEPIKQGVIVTKQGYKKHKNEVLKFYRFLFSEKAKNILKRYGYEVD
ncbi:molybdate ABC transporter substrate-binding protein [Nitrosophilus labii]|uniref:molybdate ABC transporter substrate-binding protein n=1 Tax=Nitrosophilus labii TaxID=2706014 RepID=UPI001656D864|nr:molybdate ABC transporter substrate-binding protein [Nitrosophilus labii]